MKFWDDFLGYIGVVRQDQQPAKFIESAGATIDSDDNEWRKLTGDSQRDLSPMTQKRMQKIAMYLWESNLLANRIIELPLAFMLSQGVKIVADDEDIQQWIDDFWNDPINQMDIKLTAKVRQLSLFGEQCYPAFVNDYNGDVRLGYLDPAQIESVVKDPDNNEQPIGIVTVKNKKGIAKRYRIIVNGPESIFTQRTQAIRQTFDDGECFYFNINSFSNGDRGRSDLLAQADWLDAYDQFLYGEFDRVAFLRAFIWDVTLANANDTEVKAKAKSIHAPRPGSVRVHNDSEIWKAESPDINASDSGEQAKLFRNHILGGATLPEHWFGGAGDVNRAVGAEMGTPTFKLFEMRQTYIGYMLHQIIVFVLRKKLGTDEIITNDSLIQFDIQWPNMIEEDTTKYASALSQVTISAVTLIDNQFITKETALQMIEKLSAKLGVPFDATEELDKAIDEYEKIKQKDVFSEA